MSALAGHTLAGTGPLLRASLKYEKKSFAPWIVIATALSVSSVVVYPWVYPEQADRVEFAAVVGPNPALSLVFGPLSIFPPAMVLPPGGRWLSAGSSLLWAQFSSWSKQLVGKKIPDKRSYWHPGSWVVARGCLRACV